MEEPVGSQYAYQVAVNTLKERCRNLQQRLATLEEENVSLRVQCRQNEEQFSGFEIDNLKAHITELTEQKQQLLNKIRMVTTENQELWSKLGKLTQVNQNLGTQLTKINDSLVQYSAKSKDNKEPHAPLIRSKTFTQDEPHTKVLQKNLEENGRMCSELEEISLKIINSIAQGKNDLDSLYSEMMQSPIETIITDSCSFSYEEVDNNLLDDFNLILEELHDTREVVYKQNIALKAILKEISIIQGKKPSH